MARQTNRIASTRESPSNVESISRKPYDCLLSGSDPVEAIEQENGVPVDDVLRSVNSSHGAFESPLVHTLGLCNVIADPTIVAEFVAKREGTRYGAITRRLAL